MTTGRAGTILSGTRVRAGIIGIIMILSLLLLLSFNWERKRSFLVETETFGAEIVSDGSERGNWWVAAGALVCRPRPDAEIDAETGPGPHPDCHAGIYDVTPTDQPLSFRFPEGTRVQLESGRAGALVAEIEELGSNQSLLFGDGSDVPAGTRLVVPWEVFAASGSLPFSGDLRIGRVPDEGERRILRSGRYSIRERLRLLFWGPGDPIPVASGEFHLGDSVSFVFPDEGESVFGFVTAAVRDDLTVEPGFLPLNITAYTELSNSRMLIDRFMSSPTEITTRWTDRAMSDPWPIALTIILTISALVLSIVSDSESILKPDSGTKPGDGASGPLNRKRNRVDVPTSKQDTEEISAAERAAEAPPAEDSTAAPLPPPRHSGATVEPPRESGTHSGRR